MTRLDWIGFGIYSFGFLIIALASKKYTIVFLTWLYLTIGATIMMIIKMPLGIFFAFFWYLYPVFRGLRR